MLVSLLALALPAFAQDQEYPEGEQTAPATGRTETNFEFESEYHEYNNTDFRALDESSDQSILDSDDKNAFAFTGIAADISYAATADITVDVGVSHRGLWGNDQIGNINAFGGFLYVTSLNMAWTPLGTQMDDGTENPNPLRFVIGRQYFTLGATTQRDYVFADVIDGAVVEIPLGGAGHLGVMPVSIVSSSGDNANANFFDYIGQSTTQTHGFRGDTMTRRYGAWLALDGLSEGLDTRAYFFYTDVGALGSGSDISYNGELGNFADNDWVANYGVRAKFEKGALGASAEFAGSMGIDRKELVAQDVDANGFAYGASVVLDTTEDDSGPGVALDWWEAWGAAYTDDGMLRSHGYVSMKGHQTGGLITNRFLGWHPSAYVGMFGVEDDPHEPDRKSGTRMIHAGAFYELMGPLRIDADGYMFMDTGLTELDLSKLDTIVPPYGYSRGEFAAEERLGKGLGMEIDAKVTWTVNDNLELYANGGMFMPGEFYAIEISRIAGDQLGGQETAFAGNLGTRVEF